VPGDRRFCVCGAALARPGKATKDKPPEALSMLAEWSGNRAFRRSMRAAAGGAAPTYDVGVSARVQLVRLLLILLLVGAVVSQIGPWGTQFRRAIGEQFSGPAPAAPAAWSVAG
jgi:hypothetical protein